MKITKDNILLFDMDGTLVDTNLANFLSYKTALDSFYKLKKKIKYNPNQRFNRKTLKTIVPNLSENKYQQIIQLKEKNYKKYLHKTKLNKKTTNILIKFYKTNRTVLVTNSRKDRALMTLNYHNLTDKFDDLIFRQNLDNKQTNKQI